MLGKTNRSWGIALALVLAFAIYLVPGFATDAYAKEAFAEQVFAEEAFAKEVLAQEEAAAEGEGVPEIEWSQDVFYKDHEGNPLKGPVSGAPAPELGENDYNNYDFAPSRMILWWPDSNFWSRTDGRLSGRILPIGFIKPTWMKRGQHVKMGNWNKLLF